MTATSRSDPARRVRELVPAREAAEHYGFTPNRTGYICCPFHGERTASLKFFDDGGWYCFGCHAGGSSIDFVMRLFGLDFRQALVRLDMDFLLSGPSPQSHSLQTTVPAQVRRTVTENRRRDAQKQEILAEIENLSKEHYRLHRALQLYSPSGTNIEDLHPLYAEALKKLPDVAYRLDEAENELRRLERDRGKTA